MGVPPAHRRSITKEQERIWRAWRLGWNQRPLSFDALMWATMTEELFEAALESTEARLERELQDERSSLRALKTSLENEAVEVSS